MEQLKTNIESVNVNLDEELIKEIDEVHKNIPKPMSHKKNLYS